MLDNPDKDLVENLGRLMADGLDYIRMGKEDLFSFAVSIFVRHFILLILFSSCGQAEMPVQSNIPADAIIQPRQKMTFNDPVFFMNTGTSFPAYFQALYRLGRFSDMVAFTSIQSVRKLGRKRLLEYYTEELAFGYSLGKLTSQSKTDSVTVLNYANSIEFATKRVSRFRVVIENDSCKILLSSLKKNAF